MGSRDIPKIVRKSITTAALKRKLVEICGSEDIVWKIRSLNWDFIAGERLYDGELDLSQQIASLELVLERIFTEFASDEQGCEVRGGLADEILPMIERIEEIKAEREF